MKLAQETPLSRHLPQALGVVTLLALLCAVGWTGWALERDRAAGQALYEGHRPLRAQLAGHDLPLPVDAVRCVNCHRAVPSGDGTVTFGVTLTGGALSRVQARRGGPPSRYDAAALCRLLRTGVDPAWVVIEGVMPRYQLSDTECQQLWFYLDRS